MDVDQGEVEETHILCIRVTNLQHDVIHNLFGHNDWEFEEVPQANEEDNVPIEPQEDGQPDGPGYIIPQNSEENECPYCLCRPCITSEDNRQMWWEDRNHAAHDWNNGLRREHYKRFWTMLYHRQVWQDERYIARKNSALEQDPHHTLYAWGGGYKHRRDLMPECVLKLVRGWFPKPPHKNYMGHKWQ